MVGIYLGLSLSCLSMNLLGKSSLFSGMMLHLIFPDRELTKLNSFLLSLLQLLTLSFMYLNLLEFNLDLYAFNMFLFISLNMLHNAGFSYLHFCTIFSYFLANLLSSCL